MIFFAASIVCQAVFINKAVFSVEDAGLEENVRSGFKGSVIRLAERSIGLTAAFLGFTLPLLLADANMGLALDSVLLWGSVGAAGFLLVYAVVLYFLHASFLRKGVYALSEKETAVYYRNHKLKRSCAIVLAVILAATFVGHQFATSIWGPYSIMKGTTFEDYDSFINYMQQDIPAASGDYAKEPEQSAAQRSYGGETYYDASGNAISEEEALTRRLEDKTALWFVNISTATKAWFPFGIRPRMERSCRSPSARRRTFRQPGRRPPPAMCFSALRIALNA